MPKYNIREIDTSSIEPGIPFFLDAIILFWLYSGYPIKDRDAEKVQMYSNFIGKLIQNGNVFETSAGNVQEILNLIERTEFNLYKETTNGQLGKKEYRKNNEQRRRVRSKVKAIYLAICQNCKIIDLRVKGQVIEKFADTFAEHLYDPMDFLIVEDCVMRGQRNIITNDFDFVSDQRLNVYVVG